jgi:hypothetical protein
MQEIPIGCGWKNEGCLVGFFGRVRQCILEMVPSVQFVSGISKDVAMKEEEPDINQPWQTV